MNDSPQLTNEEIIERAKREHLFYTGQITQDQMDKCSSSDLEETFCAIKKVFFDRRVELMLQIAK